MLEQFDYRLFSIINQDMHTHWGDVIIPFFREKLFWLPLYAGLITYLLLQFRRGAWVWIAGLLLTVAIGDTVSSKIIKKTVQRVRPCRQPQLAEQVALLVPCGAGYSYPSSHATNHFGVAMFVIRSVPVRRRWQKALWLGWAALVAFAQVYVGVHFPLDVISGGILGSIVGISIAYVVQRYGYKWVYKKSSLPEG